MRILNAKILPRVFYGLHMVEGVAEYSDPAIQDGKPYRILVSEDVAKQMDPTFEGRPLYVGHVPQVDLDRLQELADGYVMESFFNQADGKHWAKFVVVSDKGHDAILKGWKLSNAYIIREKGAGGRWHNVEYLNEVMRADYEHLAIVDNPRYEESIILTPEQFKDYNFQKEQELLRLANSKETDSMSILKIFKRSKIENAADIENMSVVLASGAEKTIQQLVNMADESEKEKENAAEAAKAPQMCNMEHKVKVGEEEMSVNDLVNKYNAAMEELKKSPQNAEKDPEAAKKKADEEAAAKKANEESEKEKKAKEEDEKKQNALNFDKLKNAPDGKSQETLELSSDRFARGKARYGSGS